MDGEQIEAARRYILNEPNDALGRLRAFDCLVTLIEANMWQPIATAPRDGIVIEVECVGATSSDYVWFREEESDVAASWMLLKEEYPPGYPPFRWRPAGPGWQR